MTLAVIRSCLACQSTVMELVICDTCRAISSSIAAQSQRTVLRHEDSGQTKSCQVEASRAHPQREAHLTSYQFSLHRQSGISFQGETSTSVVAKAFLAEPFLDKPIFTTAFIAEAFFESSV